MGLLDAPSRPPRATADASIWALGDSITRNGYEPPSSTWAHKFTSASYLAWMCLASLGRLRFGGIAATGGYTSAQIVATHLPTVVAARPAYCVVHAGTNDYGNLTEAQSRANLKTIFDALLAVGTVPIATTMLPKQTLLGDTRAPLDRLSIWITRYATAKNFPLVDLTTPFIDPAYGNWIGDSGGVGTYNTDNTHPNARGAKRIGELLWAAVSDVVQPSAAYLPRQNQQGASDFSICRYNALQLEDNNADGIPNGWNVSVNAAASYTTEAMDADEGLGNWFVVAKPSSGTGPFASTDNDPAAAGHRIQWTCKVKTAGVEAASGGKWHLRVCDSDFTDIVSYHDMTRDVELGVVWHEFTIPSGVNGLLRMNVYVEGVGASISVGEIGLFDLTAQSLV